MKALIRCIPDSFPKALSAVVPDPPIDVAKARAQEAGWQTFTRPELGKLRAEVATALAAA